MRADYDPDFAMRPAFGTVLRLIAIMLLSSMITLMKVASDMDYWPGASLWTGTPIIIALGFMLSCGTTTPKKRIRDEANV